MNGENAPFSKRTPPAMLPPLPSGPPRTGPPPLPSKKADSKGVNQETANQDAAQPQRTEIKSTSAPNLAKPTERPSAKANIDKLRETTAPETLQAMDKFVPVAEHKKKPPPLPEPGQNKETHAQPMDQRRTIIFLVVGSCIVAIAGIGLYF